MKKLLLIFLLMPPLLGFTQSIPVDSLLNVGIVDTTCRAVLYEGSGEMMFHTGEMVFIVDARRVVDAYGANHDYYHIFHKEKVYYVHKEHITTDNKLFDQIMTLSAEDKEKFKRQGREAYDTYESLDALEAMDYLDKLKPKGLGLLTWSFEEAEYIQATDITFNVINPTKKTIKYIWFNVIGYNPVGDKVIDPFKRTSLITLKAVGPIKHFQYSTYNFESAWNSNLVERVKIISIKVQYMDGSFKVITNVDSITVPDKYFDVITSSN